MRNIKYIGTKPTEDAFFDRTQIIWTPGKIDTVLDDAVATEMLRFAEFEDAGDSRAFVGSVSLDPTTGAMQIGGAAPTSAQRASVRAGIGLESTKRVTDCISNPNTVATGGYDRVIRFVRTLPVTTNRWRLRISTQTAYGTVATAAASITGVWVGPAQIDTASPYRWSKDYASNPTQVADAATIPVDGTDLVTPWIENEAHQFTDGAHVLVSIGMLISGTGNYPIDHGRGHYLSNVVANAGLAAMGSVGYVNGSMPMDVRIEYETNTSKTVGLILGTSLCGGYKAANQGIPVDMVWPQVMSRIRQDTVVVNAAVGSSVTGHFLDGQRAWERLDLVTTVPDWCLIEFSNNVMSGSDALATIQSQVKLLVDQVRAVGIDRVYLATVAPRPAVTSAVVGSLQSAVSAAATEISLDFNPGNNLIGIGTGFDYEIVTVSSVTGSGPYTATVPALTKAHAAGARVSSGREQVRQAINEWLRDEPPLSASGVMDWDALLTLGVGGWDMDPRYKGSDSIHFKPGAHSAIAQITIG